MSPKINENIIDFWRYVIYLTFLSHWFLEISCRAEKSRAEKLGAEKSGLKHHVACPDYDNVPLIFGDIRYVYVSKNQWDILLAMDFIDSIDFQRYSLKKDEKYLFQASSYFEAFPDSSRLWDIFEKLGQKYNLQSRHFRIKESKTISFSFNIQVVN